MDESPAPPAETGTSQQPAWHPLPGIHRRIVGVLIEKAKTTPDQYPLSLNALTNACNQKSNRSPQMSLVDHQVEDALVELRQEGIVGEVQGSGRVPKYRHYMKEWLGVDGPEMAVMAELLLRGDQTVGDLRGRANRMTNNEIKDVAALRPIVESLMQKKLVVPLTPAGRGQVVTHALYQDEEMQRLREKHGTSAAAAETAPAVGMAPAPSSASSPSTPSKDVSWTASDAPAPAAANTSRSVAAGDEVADVAALRQEVQSLRDEVSRLKKDIEDLWANLR